MNENSALNVLRILIFNIIEIIRYVGSIASKKLLKRSKTAIERSSQLTFPCSKSTIKTLEKNVKYAQS